jgi:PAS domain S-box-containing protein
MNPLENLAFSNRVILESVSDRAILESINDGVYVTDVDRRILFWNKACARIVGWTGEEVLNRRCGDDILSHKDRHGRLFCTGDRCPLLAAIRSGKPNDPPVVIYAQRKGGGLVPLQVSVAPLRDEDGNVIGGVQTFRDATLLLDDLHRATGIQSDIMHAFPSDEPRLSACVEYAPLEMIGGDFYSFERLSPDAYAFILADLVGHGIAAALYVMHLRLMLDHCQDLLRRPAALLGAFNRDMFRVFGEGKNATATAIVGMIDLAARKLTFASAGHPPAFLFDAAGAMRRLESTGIPLGMLKDARHEALDVPLAPGETLFCYTDCAIEARNSQGEAIGVDGLSNLLRQIGFPGNGATCHDAANAVRAWRGEAQLEDDLTMLSIRSNA